MTTTPHAHREPPTIGLPWSLLFIPVLFIAAGLSIPFALVAGRVLRRRERAFRAKMEDLGRVTTWSEFIRAVDECRGTAIEERYSLKGPDRWWWTSENVYDVCPYPTVDWLTMHKDASFLPLAEWFRHRYTSPDEGRALLVTDDGASREEIHLQLSRLRASTDMRWIEMVPPERFTLGC